MSVSEPALIVMLSSNELAETWDGRDDLVDRLFAHMLLGEGNRLAGDAGDFAHTEAGRHQLLAETHDATAGGFAAMFSDGFRTAGDTFDHLGCRSIGAFALQETENEADGLAGSCIIDADIGRDAGNQFVHLLAPSPLDDVYVNVIWAFPRNRKLSRDAV
jgi:hypothetical protein